MAEGGEGEEEIQFLRTLRSGVRRQQQAAGDSCSLWGSQHTLSGGVSTSLVPTQWDPPHPLKNDLKDLSQKSPDIGMEKEHKGIVLMSNIHLTA
ncbi:hypothetical protein NQZ68_022251 [Dissostichus eleginoides]|nr:hypothetical protein NQZ68_022251 [Dissostichus eleginoides]